MVSRYCKGLVFFNISQLFFSRLRILIFKIFNIGLINFRFGGILLDRFTFLRGQTVHFLKIGLVIFPIAGIFINRWSNFGFNAVNARQTVLPEIDFVAVKRKNFFFRHSSFQRQRKKGFGKFAADRFFGRKKCVFDKLLRNRRTALANRAFLIICDERAENSLRVNASMLEKAPVFRRQNRISQIFGNIFVFQSVIFSALCFRASR